MSAAAQPSIPTSWYFEDLPVGRRVRHSRSATVGEVENNWMSKMVMNTAQAHWNEHYLTSSPLGSGRVVFGLLTASLVLGLASQDTADNALCEVGLDGFRFSAPVHQGDTLTAYTEVLEASPVPDREDVGLVRFKHWGLNQEGTIVFEGERSALIKRRSHWGQP